MKSNIPLTLTLALVLAGLATAVALGAQPLLRSLRGDQSAHVQPTLYSPKSGHVPPVQTSSPGQIVQSILARADVRGLNSGGLSSASASPGRAEGYAVKLHVPVSADGPAALLPLWKVEVTEGAIAETFAYNHQKPIVDTTIVGVLPTGQEFTLPSGVGNVAGGQEYSTAANSAIQSSATSAVDSVGAKLISVDVLHADQPAPAVIVQVKDAHEAATDEPALTRRLFFQGSSPIYEGYYLEFDDPSGHPLLIDRASFRTGVTGRWTAADNELVQPSQPSVFG